MAIKCIIPTKEEKLFGYTEPFIKRVAGSISKSADSRNLARNLGIQTEQAVNLSKANGKKVFGKNLTDPSEWDAAVAKSGGVPNDTLVTLPTPDGANRAFLANKQTSIFPSKWSLDGNEIVPNPDWDMIGVNKTLGADGAPKGFIRLNDTLYRPAKKGEQAEYFLNVQNPSNARHGKDYILENNVDAYVDNKGRYEIFDKSQAVPVKRTTEKPTRAAMNTSQVDTALSPKEIEQKLTMKGMAPRVAKVVAGAIAGKIADDEGEYGGAWYGAALGFALGSPKVVSKIKGVYGKATGKVDPYDEMTTGALRSEEKLNKTIKSEAEGFAGDPDGPLKPEFDEQVSTPQREARNRGDAKGLWNGIFNNTFFSSGINDLESLGSATAVKLKEIFSKIQRGSTTVFRRFGDRLNQAYGTEDGMMAFKADQVRFVKSFYQNIEGVDINTITDQQAMDTFGAAVHRIITHGAEVSGGRFTFADDLAAQNAYKNQPLREFDEALLRDPQTQQAVQAIRGAFDDNADKLVNALRKSIEHEISFVIDGKYKEVARELQRFDGTVADFIDSKKSFVVDGEPRDPKAFIRQAAGQDKDFRRMLEMHDKKTKIQEMKGRYIPQKFNSLRADQLKKEWMDTQPRFVQDDSFKHGFRLARDGEAGTHAIGEVPKEVQDFFWNKRISSEILANNKDKWKLFDLDEYGSDPRIKTFKDKKTAFAELRGIIDSLGDEELRSVMLRDMDDLVEREKYLVESRRGNNVTYEVTTPQKFQEQGINPFEDMNTDAIAESMITRKVDYLTKKSNHFDRPRNYIIPTRFLETDMEKLIRSYSHDIGKRLPSIENNMYDDMMFGRMVRDIRKEISNADEVRKDEAVRRIESWYKVVQGTHKDIADLVDNNGSMEASFRNRIKKDTVLNSLGRLATAPFMYATSFYAPLQMAVMGPFLFGWKNTMKAYKMTATNPDQFKRMTQELRKMNIIHESIAAYSPEHNAAYRRSMYGDYMPEHLNKFSEFSERVMNFSANLSLSKPLVQALGRNMQDTGLLRLFGGSLLDVSGAEASLAGFASLRHVEDLVEAATRLQKEGTDTVRFGRVDYNMNKIRRELEDYGIDNADHFIDKKKEFNKYIDSLNGKPQEKVDNWMYDQMTNVLGSAVDKYHARDRLARPLAWLDNPYGRLFSQFATYSQNFGIRITRERIARPFSDWKSLYQPVAGQEDIPMFKLAIGASTGNDKLFKEVFGDSWKGAYDDFPTQAINNFYKVFGALAVGKAMLISRAGFMDITNIMANEALGNDDYEAWKSLNKQFVIGKHPETKKDVRFSELFSNDEAGYSMFLLARAAMEDAVRLGFGGAVSDKILQELRYNGGVGKSFPVGSGIQGMFDGLSKIYKAPVSELPRTIAEESMDYGLLMTPPLGTFNGLRQGIVNSQFQKPKNRDNKMFDDVTGLEGDINLIEF